MKFRLPRRLTPVRGLKRLPVVLLLAVLLLVAGTPLVWDRRDDPEPARPVPAAPVGPRTGGRALESAIEAAQQRLKNLPGDWTTWARLGSAYVQQARITADPSYYPKAEGSLKRSLDLEKTTNWQAMVGMATLANARHDFRAALDWGRRAEQVNSSAGSVHGVLVDALTQLGEYDQARDSLQRMLDSDPGVSSFTRASYDFEQRGQVGKAREALQRALADSAAPADVAFCRYYLGELAFNNGDPTEALRQYEQAITADPEYQFPYAGRARARAALGRTAEALADYERVTTALPLPELLVEYGDTLTAAGQPDRARQQYDLLGAARQLSAGNGVVDHLTTATFLADHGQPAEALEQARAEWDARHSVLAADALAWALHRNGRSAEALEHATNATGLGWRNATFYYHRGAIHEALGNRDQARRDLSTALAINPHFDILQAPIARELLDSLGGPV
ncbi:tetratricopeptide repeat protein [Micromonospora sp. NBC_01699]|uniref:tetratricopeptide repeat protein n=1 Tax=Micromonospora sp. NBC_01699 TaxID=2975984 RepID=UPI002E28051B|nr:tetratricopeptide repeat protein [Micromonospora sp. NBC_01699]